MSILDKVKQMVGGAKEKIGDATGNDDLADSGSAEQLEAEATEAGGDLKDKASGAMEDGKDKLDS
ncbi:MAG: CsbD family protein [Actinophytocola sp.]|nr:CsbD family protein [Actinophytocola sp.]